MIVKIPHAAMFIGPTGCGKSKKVVDLLQNEYRNHYEYIVLLCPTIGVNKTYQDCQALWTDDDVFLIDPKDQLLEYIEGFSKRFQIRETLFILDDCIGDKHLDERRTKLLDLATSGRHSGHSLWLLTQSYTAIPKNLRRQVKQIFCWFLDQRSDFKLLDDETNIINDATEWKDIQEKLKGSEHGHVHLQRLYPRGYQLQI